MGASRGAYSEPLVGARRGPPGDGRRSVRAGAAGRRRLWTRAGPYSRISSATVLAAGPSASRGRSPRRAASAGA